MASSLMRPILASCPMSASSPSMSITGSVSLRDSLSSISDSQLTEHLANGARRVTLTALRYVALPPAFEMVRVLMLADVCGAAWMTLAPVSRFWPFEANVTPVNSQRAFSPCRMLHG